MNLSRHFTLAELTRTSVVPPGGNEPPDAERANLEALCTVVLDPLRDAAGAAIKVTSGYRGPAVNARVGGARKSQHLEGRAADIQPTSMSVLELFQTVVRLGLPFDQVIYENKSATSKWVHVSHNAAGNRSQILLAHFLPNGSLQRYEPITAEQALAMQEDVSRAARRLDELEYDEMDDEPADEEEAPSPARLDEPAGEVKTTAVTTVGTTAAVKKKPAAKKPVAKKTSGKKTPAKKSPPAKHAAKKAPAKKAAAKKSAKKKAVPKKVTAAKKPAAKKSTAKAKKAPARKAAKPAAKKRRA